MSLKGAIDKFNAKVQETTEKEFRARVFSLANDTIRNTPVDTGRLRANWQLTIGYRPDSEIPLGAQPDPLVVVNRLKVNEQVYLSNNLEYAEPVERKRRMLARAVLKASKQL